MPAHGCLWISLLSGDRSHGKYPLLSEFWLCRARPEQSAGSLDLVYVATRRTITASLGLSEFPGASLASTNASAFTAVADRSSRSLTAFRWLVAQLGSDPIQLTLCPFWHSNWTQSRRECWPEYPILRIAPSFAFDLLCIRSLPALFCRVYKTRMPASDQPESLTTILPMFPAPEWRRSRSAAGAESSPSTKVSRLTNLPVARGGTASARRAGSSAK